MLRNGHVRFGGWPVETHPAQARQGAAGRPYTYLHTGEGWAYLCVVRDGNTRRVLGRTVGDSLHTDLVEDALRQAVALRGHLPRKVIFHADRGTQYTSAQLAEAAAELGVLRSMGRTGVCWDCQSVSAASRKDEEVLAGAF